MLEKKLIEFIKVCGLWKCESCKGGPCYATGEYPHCCIHSGEEWIEGSIVTKGMLLPHKRKLVWKKIRLRK